MSQIPTDLQYTKEHEWVAPTSTPLRIRMGITDYAQGALGDIVYVQMPKVGESVNADQVCGEVESTKSVSEIFAPVSGKSLPSTPNWRAHQNLSTLTRTDPDGWSRLKSLPNQQVC